MASILAVDKDFAAAVAETLQLILDTLRNHTALLEAVHQACSPEEDIGPSPLIEELRALVTAQRETNAAIDRLTASIGDQPEAMRTMIEAAVASALADAL